MLARSGRRTEYLYTPGETASFEASVRLSREPWNFITDRSECGVPFPSNKGS